MRRTTAKLAGAAVLGCLAASWAGAARADGYYYEARSFYVTPPVYSYLPVFGQAPIVVYEPMVTYPAPVAGYTLPLRRPAVAPAPAAAAPVRIRERQVSRPFHTRFRYTAEYPSGLEYKYRVRQDGRRVRFTERWDD